ncbi:MULTISPECIES: hypothetical protein [Kamptonema]|nr:MULTISPECIES: hypothetical protein [Kamptonema]CBN54803.1 hypothetical protein OSCI_1090033 [Kamptonema sp. PCC 6506]
MTQTTSRPGRRGRLFPEFTISPDLQWLKLLPLAVNFGTGVLTLG